MRTRGFVVAVLLLVLVNAFVLAGIAINRYRTPEAFLTLTEREMPLAPEPAWSETSSVALEIDVRHWFPWQGDGPSGYEVEFGWLDATKLAELGFDTRLPAGDEQAAVFVQRQLARRAYAMLEYEGAAWEAWKQRLADKLAALDRAVLSGKLTAEAVASDKKSAEKELRFGSRLFIVDAGTDPDALRKKHPDRQRFLILPAKVSMDLQRYDSQSPRLRPGGRISLLVDEVNIPRHLQRSLPEIRRPKRYGYYRAGEAEHVPRYHVALRVGRRWEPWMEAIVLLHAPKPSREGEDPPFPVR